jgi:hypothetical protein
MPRSGLGYTAICTALGLAIGWLPGLAHGPIAEKWDVHGVTGSLVVAGYLVARLSIGLWVGITSIPEAWYLRGPLCGALAMLPLGFVGLANSLCGPPCMFWNTATGATVGFAVAGLAWSVTGKGHARDEALR